MTVIKIWGLNDGSTTPFDGQYVVHYDPATPGQDSNGDPLSCTLVCSPDITHAVQFPTISEALEYCRQPYGLREDGYPNRPLTAFSIDLEMGIKKC